VPAASVTSSPLASLYESRQKPYASLTINSRSTARPYPCPLPYQYAGKGGLPPHLDTHRQRERERGIGT
jgi:hypothetical protein